MHVVQIYNLYLLLANKGHINYEAVKVNYNIKITLTLSILAHNHK